MKSALKSTGTPRDVPVRAIRTVELRTTRDGENMLVTVDYGKF